MIHIVNGRPRAITTAECSALALRWIRGWYSEEQIAEITSAIETELNSVLSTIPRWQKANYEIALMNVSKQVTKNYMKENAPEFDAHFIFRRW